MKAKRFRKFLGLSLALAAGLSVVSCGKKKEMSHEPDPNVPVVTTKYNITYVSAHGTKPADKKDVTEITAADIAALTDADFEFGGWFTDQACTTEAKAGTLTGNVTLYAKWTAKAPTTFALTFVSAHGTKPADKEAVSEITAEDLAVLTDADYKFEGWFTDEACTTEAVAGAITSATTLYAKWTAISMYDKISAREDKIMAEQFENENTVNQSYDEYVPGMKGFYDNNEGKVTGCTVSVVDGKAVLTDASTTGTTTLNAEIGFQYEGTVEGTLKYTPTNTDDSLNGGWSMVQFVGYQDITDENTLFALRTNNDKKVQVYFTSECGKDASNKTTYQFRGTEFAYAAGTEYEIYWKYDFATKKLTIKINNTVIIEDYDVPAEDQPVFLSGLRFITAGSDTKRGAKVDDFAVAVSNRGTVDETRTYLKSVGEQLYSKFDLDNDYKILKSEIESGYASTIAAMDAAETKDAVFGAFMNGMMQLHNCQTDTKLKENLGKQIDSQYASMASNYTVNATSFNAAIQAAKDLIAAATSMDDVNTAMNTLSTTVLAIKSDMSIRSEAILEYVNSYQAASEELTGLNLDADKLSTAMTELAAVNETYMGANRDGLLITCSFDNLDTTLANAKTELTTVVNKYKQTLEDYEAELNNNLAAYKTTALSSYDEILDSDVFTAVNAITIDFTNVETNAAALEKYNTAKTAVDNAIASYNLSKYQKGVIIELNTYVSTEVAKLAIADDYEGSEYETAMNAVVDAQEALISATESTTAADEALLTAKAAVDAKIVEIKEATEITVQFIVAGQTVATKTALVNSKLTQAEADALVGVVVNGGLTTTYNVLGYYSDDSLLTSWDFANDVITSTNKTVYVKAEVTKYELTPKANTLSYGNGLFVFTPKDTAEANQPTDEIFNYSGKAVKLAFNLTGDVIAKITLDGYSTTAKTFGLTIKKAGTALEDNEAVQGDGTEKAYSYSASTLVGNTSTAFEISRIGEGGVNLTKLTIEFQYTVEVQFNTNSDTTENFTQDVRLGTSVETPSVPSKVVDTKEYTFLGWFADEDCTIPFDFTSKILAATTIYAGWTDEQTYDVVFMDGEVVYTTVNAIENETVAEPTAPTSDDYVFGGWFTSDDVKFDFDTPITGVTTLYAKWLDIYVAETTATSSLSFVGMSSLPTGDTDVFGKKNKVVSYTLNGVTYTSHNTSSGDMSADSSNGIKMSKKNQSIDFSVVAGSTVTIYLRNGNDDGSRMFDITSTTGLSILNIKKGYTHDPIQNVTISTGNEIGGTKGNGIVITIAATEAQTITIAYSDSSTSENTIHVQKIEVQYPSTVSKTITGIAATVTDNNDGTVTVDSVKLIPQGETDSTKYITITDGYEFFVNDSTTAATITDGKISGLSNGDVITVKYGSYTSAIVLTVEMPVLSL